MDVSMKNRANRSIFVMTAVFIVSFILIVLRRPDIIFNAQPWAEDGVVWIHFIHNNGFLSTIFEPQNGYYQTISKLVFGIALQFGLENAPLIANACAISLRCFMVMFLLSSRFKSINIWYRLAMATYFIMMPNVDEGYVNITNAHWYLSVYLMMVLIAKKPDSRTGILHDYLVLFISALSGPFIVFVAPCILVKRIYERGGLWPAIKGINSFDILAALLTLLQVAAILTTSSANRTSAPLGASFSLLSDIINYRIVVGTFFDNVKTLFISNLTAINIASFIVAAIFIVIFVKGGKNIRICMLFPVIMIGFSLAKPMMADNSAQWPVFLIPGAGQRYFIVTNIFFFALALYILHWLAKGRSSAAIVVTVIMAPLYASYFNIYPLKDMHYKEQISDYNRLTAGQSINININPGWSFSLIKK
ncbi:hypothetical protein HA47_06485 [Pantoea stewartii subsp. indologenes]|uniref:hypothetical protein n=1 Tax=Pantoea stewartii TaxID=66269 RepID=UPI0005107429|nr:hypothetical protein [Pantoea stewartii]KGD84451.1 hypothetical protein HA47_06485 [Pantoea stewartii subsp. indologenes]